MRIRRIREVTIQTSETFVLRLTQVNAIVTCEECSGVELLTPESAAVLLGVPLRWIYRWVETGELHFREPAVGSVLVCPSSLRALVQKRAGDLGSSPLHKEER